MVTAGGRYRLGQTLGRGGMGEVHEAVDQNDGRVVAFKRLRMDGHDTRGPLMSLFQREYHTLSRLTHPAVVDVYEYGVDDEGPYYTMELLEGEDLRGVLPLPFARACALLHEVASVLSLLHTRQLVHRDITSRNIRVLGGRAKLFDFGALAPIGYSGPVIGTPPFVPPEALFGQPLDARADLFSLGVVLYQTLTGELPYPGRTWAEVRAAWQASPIDVRDLVPGIPPELATMTMSLVAPNRAARPRQAGQVMDLLAELSGMRSNEAPGVVRSYLVAPDLVGRAKEMRRVREALEAADRGSGGGLLVAGPAGVGRSRLLEEAALEARIGGAVVLGSRATASEAGPFAVARSLTRALLTAVPDAVRDESALAAQGLASRNDLESRRSDSIVALRTLFARVAEEHTLVVTVDDLSRVDEPSAAWLATLLREALSRRLLVVTSLGDAEPAHLPRAHRLLCELSTTIGLDAFDAEETTALVRTVFGAAPNVDAVATSLYRLSQGLPRDAMTLCEHLVETGIVGYRGGTFFLPARVDVEDLPASLAAKHARVVAALSPAALHLARALSLAAGQSLTLPECIALSVDGVQQTAQLALDELTESRVVTGDGFRYRLSHEGFGKALSPEPGTDLEPALHRSLARLQAERRDALAQAYHLLLGEREADAITVLEDFVRSVGDDRLEALLRTTLPAREVARLLEVATDAAERIGASQRALGDLRYSRMMLGTYVDYASFEALRPGVVEDLKRDSGYRFWKAPESSDAAVPAALSALSAAQAAYDGTPESERVRPPEEAVKALVQFAVAGIAVGAQASDWELRRPLPDLLRPFACLSPAIDAILENCLSVVELSLGRYERYRARSLSVLERLSALDVGSLPHGEEIRAAVIYGVASAEARMGLPCALERLTALESHPRLRVNAMDLRGHLLLQQGAWNEAAECRRLAEQLDMEGSMGQVFGSKLPRNDAEIYALGGNVTEVSHVIHQLEGLAASYRGWLPSLHLARGQHLRMRGDPAAALVELDTALALLDPLMTPEGSVPEWYGAAASRIEALTDLHRHDEAVAYGRGLLSRARSWSTEDEPEIRLHGILRALALAEAHVGDFAPALDRLAAALRVRERWGTTGVHLGVLHEARATIALRSGAREIYDESCRLACDQFRLVEDSAFFFRARHLIERGQSRGHSEIPSAPFSAETTMDS